MLKLLIALFLFSSSIFAQLVVPISVSDGIHIVHDTLGCSNSAFYCPDGPITPGMWEEELPPVDPSKFDVRFVDHRKPECMGTGQRVHFQEQLKLDTFKLRIHTPDSSSNQILFSWTSSMDLIEGFAWESLRLRDTLGGSIIDIDMLQDTLFQFTGSPLRSVYIIGISDIIESWDVVKDPALPDRFTLHQNFPNPFNTGTTISYDLPRQSPVVLSIIDMIGRTITTLVNTLESPGTHLIEFDASALSGGIYFYRLQTPEFIQVKKLALLK